MGFQGRKALVTPDTGMQTSVRYEGGNCLISISGRITIDSSPGLRILLLLHLKSVCCERLTVDLSEAPYLDTSCLAVLLEILRSAHGRKKTFCLSGLHDRPRYLLEATRILHLFDNVVGDIPQAND